VDFEDSKILDTVPSPDISE